MEVFPYSILFALCAIFCSLHTSVGSPSAPDRTDPLTHFKNDLQRVILQNWNSNVTSHVTELQDSAASRRSGDSLRARFLRSRIEAVVRSLNDTINLARNNAEELRQRLSASTDEFTTKIHEDIQVLKASVEQSLAEAIAKIQSKGVGVYECTQQQWLVANSWISSSLNDLSQCAAPVAEASAYAVKNVTAIIESAYSELQNIVINFNTCSSINETREFEYCLSKLLIDANGAAFNLSSQLAFLLLRAGRMVVMLPGSLAVCGGQLLATLNTGVTQAVVSIGECAVGIMQ